MKQFSYTIKDELGIHARPAGLLVKKAAEFKSSITLDTGVKKADARKLMAVMMLGVKQGNTVIISVEGEDEEVAAAAMEAFMNENL